MGCRLIGTVGQFAPMQWIEPAQFIVAALLSSWSWSGSSQGLECGDVVGESGGDLDGGVDVVGVGWIPDLGDPAPPVGAEEDACFGCVAEFSPPEVLVVEEAVEEGLVVGRFGSERGLR